MSRQVWKFNIPADDQDHVFRFPGGGKIVLADTQFSAGVVHLWVEVTPGEPEAPPRAFRIFGTGHEIDTDEYFHVGSTVVLQAGNHLVWHVYERRQI